ncbi:wnt family protein [Cooperia oncophora]
MILQFRALGLAGNRLDRSRIAYSCKNMKGLTKKQIRFCRKNPDMMDSVRYGAQNAYAECQYQFNKRRWNCTLIDPTTLELISDVMLRDGTRESAFVHAVSAAGVAYRVTRDCARGLNERCGCDQSMLNIDPQVRTYDYQGCSDNVQYGIAISREFVDAAERGKNATQRAILNLHNNRAGRQVGIRKFYTVQEVISKSRTCTSFTPVRRRWSRGLQPKVLDSVWLLESLQANVPILRNMAADLSRRIEMHDTGN